MAEKDKAKIDLGLLEEDDEFEEFPAEGKHSNCRKINILKMLRMTNTFLLSIYYSQRFVLI